MTHRLHLLTGVAQIGAVLVAAGCSPRQQAPLPAPPPATITLFRAEPSVVSSPGATVTLEWGTANASDVSIEQVGRGPVELGAERKAGRVSVVVDSDTVFLVSAQGAGGSDLRATAVQVAAKASSVLFSAIPATVEAGQPSTLVWNAPGATTVILEEVGGSTLDLGLQRESGSVRVAPNRTTTYRLRADDVTATTTVRLAPTVVSFEGPSTSPAAGEPVELRWSTAGATAVTLTRLGLASALPVAADQVSVGRFVDTVPTAIPPDGVLTYVLEASDGTTRTSRAVEVVVGGGVEILSLVAPTHALRGGAFPVSWQTAGATSAELIVDGRRAFLATSQGEVAAGSYTLSAPTQSTRIELIARNGRGGETRSSRTVEGVGPLSFNFFEADLRSVPTGGTPVTLRWSIVNARNVRIRSNTGAGFFRQFNGNVDSGSLVVLPNGRTGLSRVTYTIEADNGTGSAPVSGTVDIDVMTPNDFTFARSLPLRATTSVTGLRSATPTSVRGFKLVEKNPAGESFIDIRRSGNPVSFTGTNNATNLVLPSAFEMTLFGTRLSRSRLNVSRFGWFNLTTTTTAVPGPDQPAPLFGTALEPLSVAPYWAVLSTASGQVHWRIDSVSDARRLIVQWSNVRPVTGPIDARMTFQAQLYSNGKVVFAYPDLFKVTGSGAVGLVNASETDELSPSTPPASGDVFRFFDSQPIPASLRIEGAPFAGFATIGGDVMEAEGSALIQPGLVRVTEVMYRPVQGLSNAQWIELFTTADAGFDVSGWDIDFGGLQTFRIPPGSVVPSQGHLLLGQASDLGDPEPPDAGAFTGFDGGVVPRRPADVLFPTTFQPPASGAVVRLSVDGNEYARFPNTVPPSALPATVPFGTSYGLEQIRLPGTVYENATTAFVCPTIRGQFGSNGQRGTPGAPNLSCFPYELPVPGSTSFSSLAGIGTDITPTGSRDDVAIPRTLAQPISVFGASITQLTVSTNGWVAPYAATSSFLSNKLSPSGTDPSFLIAPFWDDLNGNNASSRIFFYQAPNGDVTVSWENWNFFTSTAAGDLNFQVILRQTGDVEFIFGTMTSMVPARAQGSSATSWIDIGPAAAPISIEPQTNVQPNTSWLFRLVR